MGTSRSACTHGYPLHAPRPLQVPLQAWVEALHHTFTSLLADLHSQVPHPAATPARGRHLELSGLHRVFVIPRFLFSSCRPCFFFPFPLSHVSTLCSAARQARNACRRLQCHRRLQFPRHLARRSPLLRLQLLARFPDLASRSRPLVAALISLPSPQPTPSLPADALGLRFCHRRVFATASLWARKAQHLVAILQRKSRYSNLPPSLASHNLRIWVLFSDQHFVIRSLCSTHAGKGITDHSPLQHRRFICPPSRDRQAIQSPTSQLGQLQTSSRQAALLCSPR